MNFAVEDGVKIIGNNRDYNVYEFVVDDVSCLKNIPKKLQGSFAIVAATSDVYVLNSQQEWVLL